MLANAAQSFDIAINIGRNPQMLKGVSSRAILGLQ